MSKFKNFINKIIKKENADKENKPSNYISIKESRAIIKYNIKQMKFYEAKKKRKLSLEEFTTTMKDENNIVEIEGLKTCFFTDNGTNMSVNSVSFNIPKNKIVGVVGESGCGKSVTSLSIMQLVQAPQGQVIDGEIRFNSDELGYDENGNKICYDIAKMPMQEMYKIRGKDITMIFQEPMTSLNPVFTIGYQLDEVSFVHEPLITKEKAKEKSIEMLNKVGISMPERVYSSYPHELSGGMRQRVMIAMALAGNPKLIIADEPTTALDVTIQAQILELLKEIQRKEGCSVMLITHDLGVIAEMADEVVVMYAGRVIEKGTVREIFHNPMHPYTIGLQKSKPLINSDTNEPLYSIPGQVPSAINLPNCCYFRNRCNRCIDKCRGPYPKEIKVSDTHYVSCYLYEENEVKSNGGNK
ncbi:MAG: ABC transporter ATP-binding protein [Coprobacillus sp.]|nr:ABC transporter ATP-binding protein [Coprobacillus sp.]MDY4145512.1 ABC transporter ATP-binding protein [Bacilli bacterium]CCY07873.1 oligopeptide/dipeptide ABC transporter ATPase subunit [Coprobacillus sp. CAG:698]